MTDFIAIDFETANGYRSSVCSVGIVIVRNGEIVNSFYSLIRPEPNYYNRINTSIHGLSHRDTCNASSFPEVWAQIEPLIGDLPFVAHNSPFDQSCLKAVFKHYGMHYPDYTFYCTCNAARQKLKGLVPNHRLHTVALHYGYNLSNHHNALADAEACAHIAIHLL